jgi:hypothetical protein
METSITLYCPGALAGRFEEALAGIEPRANTLIRTLLARARPVMVDPPEAEPPPTLPLESPEERWLRSCFEVPAGASIGAYAAAGASSGARAETGCGTSIPAGWIIRPVSLHVGLDHLVLLPPDSSELSAPESEALLAASRDWLAEEPVGLEALSPGLWQLTELTPELTRFDLMQGASSRQAAGRNIDAWLPKGPSSRGWRRLANELQMLWHDHPVNLARQARGLPVINGLWFEGRILAPGRRPFDVIVSEDLVLLGLGRLTGARTVRPTDRSAVNAALTDAMANPSSRCLIDPGCWQASSGEFGVSAWGEGWQKFAQWLIEFDAVVRPGRGRALRWLLSGHQRWVELELTRRARLRFWQHTPQQRWFEEMAP